MRSKLSILVFCTFLILASLEVGSNLKTIINQDKTAVLHIRSVHRQNGNDAEEAFDFDFYKNKEIQMGY